MSRRRQESKYELLMANHSLIPALTSSQGFPQRFCPTNSLSGGLGEEKKNLLIASYLLFFKVCLVTGPTPFHFILCVFDHIASATGWRLRDTVMGMVRRRQTMLKETWKIRIVTLGRVSLWTARQGCRSGCLINRIQTTVFKKFREYKGTHHLDSEEDENW